jgi:hypothetical protein
MPASGATAPLDSDGEGAILAMRRPFNDVGNQDKRFRAEGHRADTIGFRASDPRSDGAAIGCIRSQKSE